MNTTVLYAKEIFNGFWQTKGQHEEASGHS